MKIKANGGLYISILVTGIICLMAALLQSIIIAINLQIDSHTLPPFLTSDAMLVISLLIPEFFLFLYTILRLYREMQSLWKMLLSAVGYPLVGLAWTLIIMLSGNSFIAPILGYGSFIAAIIVPIIFSISGLVKKISGFTLISFMIYLTLYTMYTFSLYGMSDWDIDNAVSASIFFILPLMLFLASDLALQYRLTTQSIVHQKSIN